MAFKYSATSAADACVVFPSAALIAPINNAKVENTIAANGAVP